MKEVMIAYPEGKSNHKIKGVEEIVVGDTPLTTFTLTITFYTSSIVEEGDISIVDIRKHRHTFS